jgi:DNA-binding transcriptional ArsR family regulator
MHTDVRAGLGQDDLGLVFGALSDPTRRQMLETMLRDGSASVPSFTAELPITRQGVAKHLAALEAAGLIERAPAAGGGREVRFQPRPVALAPATDWLQAAGGAWTDRLERLKSAVEKPAVRKHHPTLRKLASGKKKR